MIAIRLLALLAALLLLPATAARAQDSEILTILADCEDDSILQGNYPVSAMRQAIKEQPANILEYTDCGDVLSRAIAAKTKQPKETPAPAADQPTDAGAGTPPASTGTPAASPATTPALTGKDPGIVMGPSTDQDWQAIGTAHAQGGTPPPVSGRPVSAEASVGRNALPGSVVAVLAVLVLLAAALVATRSRILPRR